MRYINAVKLFLSLVWRNWRDVKLDKWHLLKYRIGIRTAWKIAKGCYLDD